MSLSKVLIIVFVLVIPVDIFSGFQLSTYNTVRFLNKAEFMYHFRVTYYEDQKLTVHSGTVMPAREGKLKMNDEEVVILIPREAYHLFVKVSSFYSMADLNPCAFVQFNTITDILCTAFDSTLTPQCYCEDLLAIVNESRTD